MKQHEEGNKFDLMKYRLESAKSDLKSANSVIISSPSTLIMPKRGASDQGTSMTEMVQAAPAALCRATMSE